VYRAQDLNQVRVDLYQHGEHTDGRNLGLAEVVAQFKDGTENVFYVSLPRWGDKNKHSEFASMHSVQLYLGDAWKEHMTQDIKTVHILVISQFNICQPCMSETGQFAHQLRSQLTGVRVIVTLWQVRRYINPYDPHTWIAPTQLSDLYYRGMVYYEAHSLNRFSRMEHVMGTLYEAIREKCARQGWYGPDVCVVTESDPQTSRFEFPPATKAQFCAAEKIVGFSLPQSLRELHTHVANGGFGPSYGLRGVTGGVSGEGGTIEE